MTDPGSTPRPTKPSGLERWVHICERCGERMEERQCKIVCGNCGAYRDCTDP
jgi:hypothetical protein